MSRAFKIKDFPEYYVTDNGDVYSRTYHNKYRIKKRNVFPNNHGGYLIVALCKNKKNISKQIHRLVAEAFIPNPENKPEVNHKNGIKTDNRVENLEWVTRQENVEHSFRCLGQKPIMLGKFGANHNRSKAVIQKKDGKVIAEYGSQSEAQRATGVSQERISMCCLGKIKTAGKYEWVYKT